jgi:hypothetical protein
MTVNVSTVGPGLLTIGSPGALTNFSSQLRGARIVPNVTKGDPIDVLSGEQVAGDRSESAQLVVRLQSDFGHDDSRAEWLWAHRGETHPFAFVPNNALGRRISGQIVVEPVEIGGDVKTKPDHEVTFDCVGMPIFDDAS